MTTVTPQQLSDVIRQRLRKRLNAMTPSDPGFLKELRIAALSIETEAKLNIRRGGTGINKKRTGGLIDTGRMLNSMFAEVETTRTGGTIIAGSRGLAYPAHHEFGAPGANIPARPFLQPAVRKAAREFITAMEARLAKL